jgi:hypothetical protein
MNIIFRYLFYIFINRIRVFIAVLILWTFWDFFKFLLEFILNDFENNLDHF